jgi:peptidoglycan/LPS O-acetylase OafA/YrhL
LPSLGLPRRATEILGKASYTLYLIHGPFGTVLIGQILRILPPIPAELLGTALICAAAAAMALWIEEPLRRFFRLLLSSTGWIPRPVAVAASQG